MRVLVAVIVVLSACTPAALVPPTAEPAPTEEPFYAPDFTLESLTGEMVRLSEQRGTPVVVNFWATWCPPCVEEMPALQALADSGVKVFGINMREDAEAVRDFVTDLGITYPILLDPDDATVLAYSVLGLPQTVVIDANGVIVDRRFGPIDETGSRLRIPR